MPDVTGITALDVGIGLAFVYLLFSVLCSAVQEAIAALFDLRARTLEDGLKTLLEDTGRPGEDGARLAVSGVSSDAGTSTAGYDLFDQLMSHGLIRTQYRAPRWWRPAPSSPRRGPSYLRSRTFALALLDIVERRGSSAVVADSGLHDKIAAATIPAGTKDALLALAKDTDGNRDELLTRVEAWFDAGMDRVSGWYKRKAQLIICGLALAVTLIFNINTIALADRLVRDDALRAAVVADATKSTVAPGASVETTIKKIDGIRELGLPIGRRQKADSPAKIDLEHHFWRTVGGLLITFLMLSLGAPFWFDALGRLVALRGSGTKPDAKPATAQ